MSLQQGGQMQLVYPATETNPPSHRQSDGSFGAVFIVLGVIVVVSVIACFLGRLFKKRYNKSKPSKHGRHTKERYMEPKRNAFQTKDGDMEFGFDKRFSSAKVAANEPSRGRLDSFQEPHKGRPNSFREGEYRDDQMRFGGDEDHQMNSNSGTGPQYY
ncbi:hypothetical protein E3N88_37304 [Mikania micrantha]|uniref:Uncharacterized protein n=1 Tax=Mikania micrantha TaxID=192012 RepID=A0A5N6LQP3_9ASTR|nr:hypothetical protein E3N88_37304 [Mikania micrantha]